MKRKQLERILKDAGYWILRSTKHIAWTNGLKTVFIPSHTDIRSHTVHQILKQAELRR